MTHVLSPIHIYNVRLKQNKAMTEEQRWGLVYCPKARVLHPHKLWEKVRAYMETKGVLYDFVQSDGPGSVERLVHMLVKGGYRTIVIVGGDGALCQAVNALMAEPAEVRERVALGIIPNGRGNDFAHFWGLDEKDFQRSVRVLVSQKVRRVDVGLCRWTDNQGVCEERYFMNCVTVGLVARLMGMKRKARRFWGMNILGRIGMLFQRVTCPVCTRVNKDVVDQRVLTVCVGNAHGYGLTPGGVPYNGLLDVSVVFHARMLQMVNGLWMLFTGRFLNHPNVKAFRTRDKVRIECPARAGFGIDGYAPGIMAEKIEVEVLPERIRLVVP